MIEFLLEVFEAEQNKDAIVWQDQKFTYGWLLARVRYWQEQLALAKIPQGEVVVLEADFAPNAVALFLALIQRRCILVPLSDSVKAKRAEFLEIASAQFSIKLDRGDDAIITQLPFAGTHPLYETLRQREHPGLLLFSSGSTGPSKAAAHDVSGILAKFKNRRPPHRAISFLLFDHMGGVNTMLHVLSNGGCLITVPDRSPDSVLRCVEEYKAELLPISPTFLNLVLLSEAFKRHDLSSLKIVSYGTEPMPESTLRRFHELFPAIKLQQMYGLSEIGILRSKSMGDDSLWVKVGGEGFETRIVDGIFQIKAQSAMLGYLNAPSPFTADGWFITGDEVKVNGDYVMFLGRRSEMINVGGEKVFPAEVESVIQEMENIADVTVVGEANAITGNFVCARVSLLEPEEAKSVTARIKSHCRDRLANYKVPVRVSVVNERQHGERFKKMRRTTPDVHAVAR
jgi:acyl-coenzyme A synthetase/AMP-(fatty) acid ligase